MNLSREAIAGTSGLSLRHQWRRCTHRGQPCRPFICRASFTLTAAGNTRTEFNKETITVGTGSAADWAPAGPHVAGEHAQLIQKGGRVLCVALQGDEDDLTSRTYTWVNGNEIRKGVPYVLASGTKLAFGQPEEEFELTFEEPAAAGSSAMFESVLRGMAAGSSDEVRRRIEDSLGE